MDEPKLKLVGGVMPKRRNASSQKRARTGKRVEELKADNAALRQRRGEDAERIRQLEDQVRRLKDSVERLHQT